MLTVLSQMNPGHTATSLFLNIPFDIIIIIIIITTTFIYCNLVVTRWQWLFYMYTKYEIGY